MYNLKNKICSLHNIAETLLRMALNTNQSCNLQIIVYLQVEAIVKQRDMFKVLAQQEGLQVVSFHFTIYVSPSNEGRYIVLV